MTRTLPTPVETRQYGDLAEDNYIRATAGLSSIRGLQLLRQSGIHSLEPLKAATHGSARAARLEAVGVVGPGYPADLILVDGNPAENANLMREVERMVAESREGAEPLTTQIPFIP